VPRAALEVLADHGVPGFTPVHRLWHPPLVAALARYGQGGRGDGPLVGLFVPVIGIMAGIGLVLYFTGAVVTVVRARWFSHIPYPALFLALVVASSRLGSQAEHLSLSVRGHSHRTGPEAGEDVVDEGCGVAGGKRAVGDEAPVEERPGQEVDCQLEVCRRGKFATLLGPGQDVQDRFAAALGELDMQLGDGRLSLRRVDDRRHQPGEELVAELGLESRRQLDQVAPQLAGSRQRERLEAHVHGIDQQRGRR
jgi:hypothetical protein